MRPVTRPVYMATDRLPQGIRAVTVFPFIVIDSGGIFTEPLHQHEMWHWKQQRLWLCVIPVVGLVLWFVVYGVLYLCRRRQYKNEPWLHPMERRAYQIQWDMEATLQHDI
mgnify:CR=1 FL=1